MFAISLLVLFAICAIIVVLAINEVIAIVYPNSKVYDAIKLVSFFAFLLLCPSVFEFLFMMVDMDAVAEFVSTIEVA